MNENQPTLLVVGLGVGMLIGGLIGGLCGYDYGAASMKPASRPHVRPLNRLPVCTCSQNFQTGSGHSNLCEVQAEWERRGGFDNPDWRNPIPFEPLPNAKPKRKGDLGTLGEIR